MSAPDVMRVRASESAPIDDVTVGITASGELGVPSAALHAVNAVPVSVAGLK
jgi:hypothetical protein